MKHTKGFTEPKRMSPFYDVKRIPRKLKKKVKSFCAIHWDILEDNQRLWYYLEDININYKHFLIRRLTEKATK